MDGEKSQAIPRGRLKRSARYGCFPQRLLEKLFFYSHTGGPEPAEYVRSRRVDWRAQQHLECASSRQPGGAPCCPQEKWNFLAASFVGGITLLCLFSRVFRFPLPGKILRGSWGQSPPSGISAFESFYHLFIVCLPPWNRDTENVHSHQLPLYDS